MNIKVLVATHKKYWMPNDEVYLPIHVGSDKGEKIGYQPDNVGDNISAKNPYYCELTALYWGWKNLNAEYVGLCHYRRYFTRSNPIGLSRERHAILTKKEYQYLLSQSPIIVGDKRRYYIETIRSHYNHTRQKIDLDHVEEIIRLEYPQYEESFHRVMNRTWAHMFNMFVMRWDYYDQYCKWLFDILGKLEKKTDIKSYNKVEARVYGYISELLLDVWLEKNKLGYKEVNICFIESQNWLKKGFLFLKHKYIGK